MKIAVLLKGSSIASYSHWQYNDLISTNYKNNIQNLKTNLLEANDCDVFFHTWRSPEVPAEKYEIMAKEYDSVSYMIEEDIPGDYGPNLGKKVATTASKVIEIYKEYTKKNLNSYDLIIMVRFDVYLFFKLDFKKIFENVDLTNLVCVYDVSTFAEDFDIDKSRTKIKNLRLLMGETNKHSLHGIIKQISRDSHLISGCNDEWKTCMKEDLYVIHYR